MVARQPTLRPELFDEELALALDRIRSAPATVAVYRASKGGHRVRRVLMPKTNNHVYFVHDAEARVVRVVALWGAVKRRRPPLTTQRPLGDRIPTLICGSRGHGGKAEVSHPRPAIKGADFKRCVVETFEPIAFEMRKGGMTVVSYSLRFTPERTGRMPTQ